MHTRPYMRYRRFHGSKGYYDKYPCPKGDVSQEFLSGDSHCYTLQHANRGGFRSSNACYTSFPQSPQYYGAQYVNGSVPQHRLPTSHQFPGTGVHVEQNQPSHIPVCSSFGNNKQLSGQLMRQTFRSRSLKPPDYRTWDYANPGPPTSCDRFTVLSYNILADYLAMDHSQLYTHIPRYILDWNWRRRSICFELGLWLADILCLQEVDRFPDIESELKLRGYNGIWKMRTGDAVDGCATFWLVSRFKLLHEESIEYKKIGLRDNVAQICVLEFLRRCTTNSNQSDLGPSPSIRLDNSNKVVICNIHVLYNPKRGDIKLGQIRVLFERAHVISKHWDAPIVICGDFNCTPKSPMYNFISEQKLDLSKLSRDKVSGQASAEIYPSRSSYNDSREKHVDTFTQSSFVNPKNLDAGSSSSDVKKISNFMDSRNASPGESHLTPKSNYSVVDETSGSSVIKNHMVGRVIQLSNHVSSDKLHPEAIYGRHNYLEDACSSPGNELSCKHEVNLCTLHDASDDLKKNSVVSDAQFTGDDSTSPTTGTSYCDVSKLKHRLDSFPPNFPEVSLCNCQEVVSSCCGSNSSDVTSADMLDKNLESSSSNEAVNKINDEDSFEDRDSFLSELHDTTQSSFAADSSTSFYNQKLNSCNHILLNDTSYENHEVADGGKHSGISPSWTALEMQTATGRADCKVMEHSLKLRSAYTEVQDPLQLRDSSGEPLVTSYHKKFLGTVDYIWLSEGLQAAKVLAPIPKHVMQQTPGFPTKKWGSDHIALVSELAFTKKRISENSS